MTGGGGSVAGGFVLGSGPGGLGLRGLTPGFVLCRGFGAGFVAGGSGALGLRRKGTILFPPSSGFPLGSFRFGLVFVSGRAGAMTRLGSKPVKGILGRKGRKSGVKSSGANCSRISLLVSSPFGSNCFAGLQIGSNGSFGLSLTLIGISPSGSTMKNS